MATSKIRRGGWFLGVVIGLTLLGSLLRVWQYWALPVAGETQDEVAWTLLGASLLQTGTPASWSYFGGYETFAEIESGGAKFRVVRPVLDHPPLFSLLPGGAQTLAGRPWLEIPSIKLVRFPVVLLSIFNLGLLALWLWRTGEQQLGKAGKAVVLAVFATAPSFVFLSRLVVSENLLLTWILFLLIARTVSSPWKHRLQFIALLALPLTKIAGLAVSAAEVVTDLREKRQLPRSFWPALLGMMLLLGYAALYNLPLFFHVQAQQAQRDAGLLTLFSSQIWLPSLIEKPLADVWITLGYIFSLAWLVGVSKKDSEERHLAWLLLAQIAFIVLSVGERTAHGWYRIVLLPFFAYAIGWFADHAWKSRNWFGLATGWLLAMPSVRLGILSVTAQGLFQWQAALGKGFLVLAGGSAAGELLPTKYRQVWWKTLVFLLVLAVLSGNILTILFLRDQAFWQDEVYLEQGIRP